MSNELQCVECSGELIKKQDLFTKERMRLMRETFRKEFDEELVEPTGYVCTSCGASYDDDMIREKYNLMWLVENGKGKV